MKLHEYKDDFDSLISIVANKLHIPESAVDWILKINKKTSYNNLLMNLLKMELLPNRYKLSKNCYQKS